MPADPHLRPDPVQERYETLLEVARIDRCASPAFHAFCRPQPPAQAPGLLRFHHPDAGGYQGAGSAPAHPGNRRAHRKARALAPYPLPKPPPFWPWKPASLITLADLSRETRFPLIRDLLRSYGIQSYCVLPLFTAQRDLGGLHFGSLQRERLLRRRHRIHAACGAAGGRGGGQRAEFRSRPGL